MVFSTLLRLLEAGEVELTASSADSIPLELAALVGYDRSHCPFPGPGKSAEKKNHKDANPEEEVHEMQEHEGQGGEVHEVQEHEGQGGEVHEVQDQEGQGDEDRRAK